MNEEEYAEFVSRKWVNNLTSGYGDDDSRWSIELVAAAIGVAGESGEVVDVIKKATVGYRSLSFDKLIEELGDLEFYLQKLRTLIDVRREAVLEINVKKLNNRYPHR